MPDNTDEQLIWYQYPCIGAAHSHDIVRRSLEYLDCSIRVDGEAAE